MTALTENAIGLDGRVFPDRRETTRRRVLKGARLSFNRGYAVFECVVRNMSDCGARLSFGDSTAVPGRFELLITDEDYSRTAIVRWRSMNALGVTFE
ncbi:PilZ domain-containing protein [Pseudaminobacter sp. 19-2017]|uniref:PilZ domain-containing protein n=1 Tax=Pseudaminobacter soli (ex Zhang et al. 2022) TaxID=2831468 RepID=A0A942I9R9_9HYPH|nr:PilZ domain-containing protein [Pseudaminobacter soli]MBS3650600.1 PilZ domain-containing protein [Pseudaminobacter soli]